MAIAALAGYGCMCTGQNVIVVVGRESSRLPVRVSSMAGCTIGGDAQCRVTGISGLIVIVLMAPGTGIWRIGIAARVTEYTISGYGSMCTGKRINSGMIKRGR